MLTWISNKQCVIVVILISLYLLNCLLIGSAIPGNKKSNFIINYNTTHYWIAGIVPNHAPTPNRAPNHNPNHAHNPNPNLPLIPTPPRIHNPCPNTKRQKTLHKTPKKKTIRRKNKIKENKNKTKNNTKH